jgi:signal transduction histidine kinase
MPLESVVNISSERSSVESAVSVHPLSFLLAKYVHRLRSPLVSVRGYSRMLLERRAGPLTEPQAEYLQVVVDEACRMVRLLGELSQLHEMAVAYPSETIDVGDLIHSLVARWTARATASAVQIERGVPASRFFVSGDPELLSAALDTVLHSAVEQASSGETIRISWSAERGSLRILMVPSSCRTAEQDESGYPSHDSADDSGLPEELSFVEGIIRLHGGGLCVERSAQGSSFMLHLPSWSGREASTRRMDYDG